jgi:hypothetical protein
MRADSVTKHLAQDHPVLMSALKETQYLKFFVFQKIPLKHS